MKIKILHKFEREHDTYYLGVFNGVYILKLLSVDIFDKTLVFEDYNKALIPFLREVDSFFIGTEYENNTNEFIESPINETFTINMVIKGKFGTDVFVFETDNKYLLFIQGELKQIYYKSKYTFVKTKIAIRKYLLQNSS